MRDGNLYQNIKDQKLACVLFLAPESLTLRVLTRCIMQNYKLTILCCVPLAEDS